MALWLERLGARITGLALPHEDPAGAFAAMAPWPGVASYPVDLRDRAAVAEVVDRADPEIVLHLAAQPLVRRSHLDPVGTYEVNVIGTANLLAALNAAPSLRAVVVVTTDKVYANHGRGEPLIEGDPLGGGDPYSASKACTELVVGGWHWPSSAPAMATARAGNVIGGGDVAADRLLPDIRRVLRADTTLMLRYPDAVRPWQFVLEPLYGYLLLAEHLTTSPGTTPRAINFGPRLDQAVSVAELVKRVFDQAGAGRWKVDDVPQPPEASILRLDAGLAERALGWRPQLDLDDAIAWTLAWWRAEADGSDLRRLATSQIEQYEGRLAR